MASKYTIQCFKREDPLMETFTRFSRELYAGDPLYLDKPVALGPLPASFFLVLHNGTPAGRAAAIINPAITYQAQPTGLIGFYECADDREASLALFRAVLQWHRENGTAYVIGPMNGTTWGSYRITEPDGEPPFFLDNYHKAWYADQFRAAGFETVARYYSSRTTDLDRPYDRVPRFLKRFEKRGIVIRPTDLERFDEDLEKIYNLSREGFRGNFLYTDLPREIFMAMYSSVKQLIDPRFVLLAGDADGTLLGFIFALNNIFQQNKRSLIIKTVAVLPGSRSRGIGTLLVEMIHRTASELGYDEIIHALMHQDNMSLNIAAEDAHTFRTYTLFGKTPGK